MSERSPDDRWLWLLLVAGILLSYFVTLGWFPLAEPDEARYAEIPREMLASGDWITPHLNYVKYFEKPPLVYWLSAISLRLFGFSELAVRIIPASFGLLGIWMVYLLGTAMWDRRTSLIAVAVLATSPFYFGMGQILTLDMPLSGILTLAVGSFWFAYARPEKRDRWLYLFYAFLAFATLTKGPVSIVLVGGILGSFVLLRWEWEILRWALPPRGILLFLAISLPWHLLVSLRNPEFFQFYIVDQHLKRYLAPDEHREPLWFFIPIVLGGAAPWTLLPLGLRDRIRTGLPAAFRGESSAATLYCTLWAVVVFLFFSLSGSKLATYILPMMPPLALLLACCIEPIIRERPAILALQGKLFVWLAGLFAVASLVVYVVVDHYNGPTIALHLALAVLPLVAGGAAARQRATMGQGLSAFGILVATMLAVQIVAISGRSLAQNYKVLGEMIRVQARPEDIVASYRHFTQAIPLYSQRRVVQVRSRGELEFGSRLGDQSAYFWDTDEELIARWNGQQRMFLVANRSELNEIANRLEPRPREIAAFRKKVLVVNFPDDHRP